MRTKVAMSLGIIIFVLAMAAIQNFVSSMPVYSSVVVTRVVDGDTIVVEGGERVRLLDIDTPEKGEPCSANATARLKELIDGKEIGMESRGEDRDTYGRLLRYIYLNDTMINLVMVREGWANLYIYDKGPYYSYFVEAEQAAKAEKLCVWQK